MAEAIATWEQLMGTNNWEGLVEPELELDLGLRDFTLRCGNFCSATYDAFRNSDGESRYGMSSFFHDVMLQDASHYEVVSFLYAPSGCCQPKVSNWIGYVAVTTDEFSETTGRREIYVVWRGTNTLSEWCSNVDASLQIFLKSANVLLSARTIRSVDENNKRKGKDQKPEVHSGWLKMYTSTDAVGTSVRSQLMNAINKLKEKQNNENDKHKQKLELSVVVTGHSLGGALATLSAVDLVESGVVNARVAAIVFCCPKVGNQAFKTIVEDHQQLNILHVKNERDIIPDLPCSIPMLPCLGQYVPIQTSELKINTDKSPYLNIKSASKELLDRDLMIQLKRSVEKVLSEKSSGTNIAPSDLPNLQKLLENVTTSTDHDDLKEFFSSLIPLLLEILLAMSGIGLLGKLKEKVQEMINFHNLEATLHVVAWWNGPDKEFGDRPNVERSLALVNKWSAFLIKDEIPDKLADDLRGELWVPDSWWMEKNTGMLLLDEKNPEPVSVPPTWERLINSSWTNKLVDWKSFLEAPINHLNSSPKKFLLQCGDFCQATYDCFNSNPISRQCGNSRYGTTSFLDKVMLPRASHYQVCSFLYASTTTGDGDCDRLFFQPPDTEDFKAWDRSANWIGYVAVTTDKVTEAIGHREIYVVWRGSIPDFDLLRSFNGDDWLCPLHPSYTNLPSLPFHKPPENKSPKVHRAWNLIYTSSSRNSEYAKKSAKDQLKEVIQELMDKYKDEKEPVRIVITGHSLGGALAVLSAYDLVEHSVVDKRTPIWAIVFGCPRVGDASFRESLANHGNLMIIPIKNKQDNVPYRPDYGSLVDLRDPKINSPAELVVNTNSSSYLVVPNNSEEAHNLEVTLHMIAGLKEELTDFDKARAAETRNLALINKSSGCLSVSYNNQEVPKSWWVEKNKGMVLEDNGKWVLDPQQFS